jgi:hypothetical protein
VVNSSTDLASEEFLDENGIPFINSEGSTHGNAVNFGLSKIKTKYVLLLDSDVLLLSDITPLFERFKRHGLTIMGEISGNRGGKSIYSRVNPWFCFLDNHKLKKAGIQFFNEELTRYRKTQPEIFDMGSSLFYEIMIDTEHGLSIGDLKIGVKYFKHYEGMSWRVQKYDPNNADTDIDFGGTHPNKGLYEAGLKVQEYYDSDTKYLNGVDIKDYFKESILNQHFDRTYCMKVLVKFPTRSRPDKFFYALDKYYELAENLDDMVFIITCDIDDVSMNNIEVIDKLKKYIKKYKNLKVYFGTSTNKIEAVNANIEEDFDVLVLASDDMIPIHKGYDVVIRQQMFKYFPDGDGALWFNDGHQGTNINTLPIMGKAYYDRFGYIYHPSYKSLYCDNEYTEVGISLKKLVYFSNCIIEHVHPAFKPNLWDNLYHTNEQYVKSDEFNYKARKANNYQ